MTTSYASIFAISLEEYPDQMVYQITLDCLKLYFITDAEKVWSKG